MSVTVLKVIPPDPSLVPDEQARAAALAYLATILPEAADITDVVTPHVEFIDQGGNFEYIRCPACNRLIDESWSSHVMDEVYDRHIGFTNLLVRTPCCGHWLSLNDLDYHWPAGFARYRLDVRDPQGELSDDDMSTLESILHCSLRRVWARY